jgi:hypothetical protein
MLDYDGVMYVFEHYVTLSRGMWPEPKTDDTGVRRPGVAYNATFETPCIAAGEVDRRVIVCGEDGILTERLYKQGFNSDIYGSWLDKATKYYAKKYHANAARLYRKVHKVAWYCTDAVFRTGQPYEEWKRTSHGHSKYRIATHDKSIAETARTEYSIQPLLAEQSF